MSYSIVSISNGGPDNAIDQLKGACNNDIGGTFWYFNYTYDMMIESIWGVFELPVLVIGPETVEDWTA